VSSISGSVFRGGWPPFRSLPTSMKREVFALARQGLTHPNPEIARSAFEWAEGITARVGPLSVLRAIVGNVVCVLVFNDMYGDSDLANWRNAKRIMKLRQPASAEVRC
jgi:hypothetical protein